MGLDIAVAIFSACTFNTFAAPTAKLTVVNSVVLDYLAWWQLTKIEHANGLHVLGNNGIDIVLAYVHSLLTHLSISHLAGPRTGHTNTEAATTVLTTSSWTSLAYRWARGQVAPSLSLPKKKASAFQVS